MSMTEHLEKKKGVIIMSRQCLVPNWNLKQQQRQQEVEVGEEGSRSSHVHSNHQNYPEPATTTLLGPMSNYDGVTELTWENGQLSMHGLGGLVPTSQEKPTWVKAHDTLESIVQQATSCRSQKSKFIREEHGHPRSASSIAASSGEQYQLVPALTKKRSRSDCDEHGRNFSCKNNNMVQECDHPSGSASGGATLCRDNEATMMTWASLESGQSFKNKILEEDSACHCGSEILDSQDDRDTKIETDQDNSTRRNRTAAVHNQSERRRRDRINQKMKALQRLVPNASKTDKASMLEEVISYLKQLQAQIQMMSMTSMPQMMVPLAMQQQLQMSMLARMPGLGLGMGMGMVNINNMAPHTAAPRPFPQLMQPTTVGGAPATGPIFVAPPASFVMPSFIQAPPKPMPASASGTNASIPLPDPFNTTAFAQSANMNLFNNMAALYRQQIMSQNNQVLSSLPQTNHEQGN